MPFAATWMDLDMIILKEVKSDRERQISYDITYVESNKIIQKHLQNRLIDFKIKLMVTKVEKWREE